MEMKLSQCGQFMTLKHRFGPLLVWTSLSQLWLPFKSFLSKSMRMPLFHVRLMSTLISYGNKTFSMSFVDKKFKQQKELSCIFFLVLTPLPVVIKTEQNHTDTDVSLKRT